MSFSQSRTPERSWRSGGGAALRSRCGSIRQHEIGKVFKYPAIFEGSVNDPQEFPSQGDDRLSRASPSFDLFVVALQIRAVALRNQGTLHQRGPTQLGPAFGDPSRMFGFVRVAD